MTDINFDTDAIYQDADIDTINAHRDADELQAELRHGHKITAYEVFGSRVCYGCGIDADQLDLTDATCTGGTK